MEKNNFLKLRVELPIHCKGQFFEVACGVAYSLSRAIFWLLSHVKGMAPTKFLHGNPSSSICVCVLFSWVNFPMVKTNKNSLVWRLYLKRKTAKVAIFWKKKGHMLPYLDNEFPLIARTKQDSKKDLLLYCLTSTQTWLIPLVDDGYSTYFIKKKKQTFILIRS
jgi:hypothetical protein